MQINLLPNLVVKRRRQAQIKRFATLGLIVWLGLLVVGALATVSYQQYQKSQEASLKTKVAQSEASVNSDANVQFRTEALEVQASLTSLDSLLNNQQKLSVINIVLAASTPPGVRLRETRIAPDGKVDISATAGTYADAGKLLASMKASKQQTSNAGYFDDVVLAGANQADTGVAFSITAVYISADGAKK